MGRLLEVLSSGRTAFAARDERVVLRVHVGGSCPREVALCVRDALRAERPGGVVDVRDLRAPLPGEELPDAVLVLAGDGEGAELIASYALAGASVGVVVEGALEAPRLDLPPQAAALVGVIAGSDPRTLRDKLASWLAGATDKPLALAACFPFCRRAVTDALVSRCAVENAAVGAVGILPGSDLPVMCANQAMLALDIAAAYGRGASLGRAAEVAAVFGGGLAWRAVARALMGLVPGAGAAVRAGVGYGGTVVAGRALRLKLELEDGPAAEEAPARAAPGEGAPASRASIGAGAAEPADDGYVTLGEAVA